MFAPKGPLGPWANKDLPADEFSVAKAKQMLDDAGWKTGGDGVHYNNEASEAWARRIQGDLDSKLSRGIRERKFSRLKGS